MHTSRIPNRKLYGLVFTILIVMLAGGLLLTGSVLAAQDPNFSDIDDPLNGEYELFTVDDLLIMRTKPVNNNTQSQINNYILETANETISSQSVLAADDPSCWLTTGSRQPQQTRVGRFFDLPYDVIVTLLPYGITASGGDCTAPAGQPNMALHIQSTHDIANSAWPFTMSAEYTAVAMDDFNQDGFEDLFIMSQAEMLVATATNVGDRNSGFVFGAVTAGRSGHGHGFVCEPVPPVIPADFSSAPVGPSASNQGKTGPSRWPQPPALRRNPFGVTIRAVKQVPTNRDNQNLEYA
jgi:hypothetical protein